MQEADIRDRRKVWQNRDYRTEDYRTENYRIN